MISGITRRDYEQYKKGHHIDVENELKKEAKRKHDGKGQVCERITLTLSRSLVLQNTTITLYLVAVYRRRDYYNKVALR